MCLGWGAFYLTDQETEAQPREVYGRICGLATQKGSTRGILTSYFVLPFSAHMATLVVRSPEKARPDREGVSELGGQGMGAEQGK